MYINIYLLKENMYSHTHMYLNTHIDGPLHKNDNDDMMIILASSHMAEVYVSDKINYI